MKTTRLPFALLFAIIIGMSSACQAPDSNHCDDATPCINFTRAANGTGQVNGSVGTAKLERSLHHQCNVVQHQINGTQVLITGGNVEPEIFTYPNAFYVDAEFAIQNITHPNYHTATRIPNEYMVVLIGGENEAKVADNTISIYRYYTSSARDTFHTINTTLLQARRGHTATWLHDSRQLLIIGGAGDGSTELFDPNNENIKSGTSLPSPRSHHTATYFKQSGSDGIFIMGGENNGSTVREIVVYKDSVFEITDNLPNGIGTTGYTATWLGSDIFYTKRILITGGSIGNEALNTFTYYDIEDGSFRETGIMTTPREQHTATLLPGTNGIVLIIGGKNGTAALNTIELYDAESNVFKMLDCSLEIGRYGHSAIYLEDRNNILIYGGQDDSGAFVTQAELISLQNLKCFIQ